MRWQYPLGGDSDAKPKAEGRERAKSIGDADVSHMGTVGQLTIEGLLGRAGLCLKGRGATGAVPERLRSGHRACASG